MHFYIVQDKKLISQTISHNKIKIFFHIYLWFHGATPHCQYQQTADPLIAIQKLRGEASHCCLIKRAVQQILRKCFAQSVQTDNGRIFNLRIDKQKPTPFRCRLLQWFYKAQFNISSHAFANFNVEFVL